MPRVSKSPEEFVIIGENIHATRTILRKGRRVVTLDDGREVVPFEGDSGEQRYLTIPEWVKETQPYQQGKIKHYLIAVMKGIGDDPEDQEEGAAYVRYGVRRQVRAGAHYLDLCVDEVSYDLDVQKQAMKWLVSTVQEASPIPPSVDSSNPAIIAEGLAAYNRSVGRPVINSCSLERLETLDMVTEHNAAVVITAAGASNMPQDADARVENLNTLMEAVQSKGVPLADVYMDALVFPIAVDHNNGIQYIDTVRRLRETHGDKVHITGGLSNVSFGLPMRKLVNDTFIYLLLDAGVDSGIIDPIQTKIASVFNLDPDSEPVRLASEMLLGKDEFCVNYIRAFRQGRLG